MATRSRTLERSRTAFASWKLCAARVLSDDPAGAPRAALAALSPDGDAKLGDQLLRHSCSSTTHGANALRFPKVRICHLLRISSNAVSRLSPRTTRAEQCYGSVCRPLS